MALETSERTQRTERAGIPVHWAEVEGRFTAALAFRTGVADERLSNRGITHLIEHVALSELGRREHPWNGCVDAATTIFAAEGERDEVLEFLRLVGDALCDLPEDRVELERRVLRAEAEHYDPGVVGRMLDHRFGSAGFGLLNYGEIGLRWLQPADLRQWCGSRFTRGNAVVWMTGEPPEDLGLAFRDGPRLPQPAPEPLELGLPGYVAEGRGGVALTGLAERSAALRVAMHVAGERLYDVVRGERGLAYAPAGGYSELDARLGHAFLGSDCQDDHAPAVLEALWRTVRELAADGATEEELDRYRRQSARARNDPDRMRGQLSYHALGELLADPVLTDAELDSQLEALDAAAVAAAMDQVARSAILLGPDGCPPPDSALRPLEPRRPEPLTEGDEYRAFSKRKKLTRRSHGGSTLRVSERGVTWESEDDEPGTILWERCAVVIRRPAGGLMLHDRDGSWMEVPTAGWDAATPLERLEELIPPGLAIPVCDRERFDAIQRASTRWMKPEDPVYGLIDELPALLGGEEELIEIIPARQKLTFGLLVVTGRRVVWLTYKEDKGFEIPVDAITNAYGADEQLDIYFGGNVAKVVVDPGDAAAFIAGKIRESRTEPDR
jgi:predicted Zn-dependent peptidase